MKRMYLYFTATIVAFFAPVALHANELIPDQVNEFSPSFYISPFSEIGQEFVPASNHLSFVALLLASAYNGASNRVQVAIREQSISNAIVAMSDVHTITNYPAAQTNYFLFTPDVPLVPGNKYVLQLQIVSGDSQVMGACIDTDPYTAGRVVGPSWVDDQLDFWFREGVVSATPDGSAISIHPSYVDVCWSSRSDRTYQLQYRSELNTNDWINLGQRIAGNGTTNCFTDAIVGPSRFYRVITFP